MVVGWNRLVPRSMHKPAEGQSSEQRCAGGHEGKGAKPPARWSFNGNRVGWQAELWQ